MVAQALGSGFDELCEQALATLGVPGAALGVATGGETWVRGFGVLDVRRAAPVTPDATFRIASLTKPVTALLALALAGRGRLALDEEVAAPVVGVTVRHLLAHLGGFESERGDLARFGEGADALARLAAELPRQRQVVPPGELWSYCNAGYWLLGNVLAERAGASYEDAISKYVLLPLGLSRTGFGAPRATGHEDGLPLPDRYPRARRPSGGLVADVRDLLELAAHLSGEAAAELRRPLTSTPDGRYGLGLALEELGELELWGHDGSYGGFEARLRLAPERDFAFVGLANAAGGGRALDELLDAALERLLGVRRPQAPSVAVEPGEPALLRGRYRQQELELDVRPSGDELELAVTTIDRETAERAREPTARARPIGPRLYEVLDGARREHRFDFHTGAGRPRFVRFASRLSEREDV